MGADTVKNDRQVGSSGDIELPIENVPLHRQLRSLRSVQSYFPNRDTPVLLHCRGHRGRVALHITYSTVPRMNANAAERRRRAEHPGFIQTDVYDAEYTVYFGMIVGMDVDIRCLISHIYNQYSEPGAESRAMVSSLAAPPGKTVCCPA